MTFQTLQHTPPQQLADCWNLAFSDYAVPMQVSTEQLASRLRAEWALMELSVGAFDGEKLVGFVLTGTDAVRAASYNAGTGVVPAYRGQRLTTQLYDYLLPLLRKDGIKTSTLEVITENRRAVKVYDALGYTRARELNCYKGSIATKDLKQPFELRRLTAPDATLWSSFWDWQPSWQNNLPTISRSFSELVAIGAFDNGRLVGYIVYNPLQKRVLQFATDKEYRRRGVCRQLFNHIAEKYGEEVGVINVDGGSAATNAFFQSIGLKHFLTQYEMTLQID